jgi:hypothetical protein
MSERLAAAAEGPLLGSVEQLVKVARLPRTPVFEVEAGLSREPVPSVGSVVTGDLVAVSVSLPAAWLTFVADMGVVALGPHFIGGIASPDGDGRPRLVLGLRLVADPADGHADEPGRMFQFARATLTWRDGRPSVRWAPMPRSVGQLSVPARWAEQAGRP